MLPDELERAGRLSPGHRSLALLIALVALAATAGLACGIFLGTGSLEMTTMAAGLGLLTSLSAAGIYREIILGRQARKLALHASQWPRSRISRVLSDRIPWRLRDALERLLM